MTRRRVLFWLLVANLLLAAWHWAIDLPAEATFHLVAALFLDHAMDRT